MLRRELGSLNMVEVDRERIVKFGRARAKEGAGPVTLSMDVADHIAACNSHDIEAWMATFSPDAMRNDIAREFIGTDAIRGFGEKEIFGDNVTMAVRRAWNRHGDTTVHAKLDGTYDKTGLPDPLILSFYFSLRGIGSRS